MFISFEIGCLKKIKMGTLVGYFSSILLELLESPSYNYLKKESGPYVTERF